MSKVTTPKKASPGDWHPADIKAALEKRGWTIRRLAAHNNVTPTAVKVALRERNVPAERRIADALGLHPMTIWPSRYNTDGSRLLVPRGKPSHKSCNGNASHRRVNGNVRLAA